MNIIPEQIRIKGVYELILASIFSLLAIEYLSDAYNLISYIVVGFFIGSAVASIILVELARRYGRKAGADVKIPWIQASIAVIIFLIALVSSSINGSLYGTLYGLAFIGCFFSSARFWKLLGYIGLMRAFSFSMTIFPWIILPFTSQLTTATEDKRFSAGVFHPNLLAFTLAPSVTITLLWACLSRRNFDKIIFSLTCSVAIYELLLTRSRASILAVAVALIFLAIALFSRTRRSQIPRTNLLMFVFLSISMIVVTSVKLLKSDDAASRAADFFDVYSKYRGINSGFSGRTDIWGPLLDDILGSHMFFGNGFRASDQSFSGDIDNGLLVASFDYGFLPALFLTWLYVRTVLIAWSASSRGNNSDAPPLVMLCITMVVIVFLVNNVFSRYMFGIGNVFSIFGLFMLTFPVPARNPLKRLAALKT